jgi:hypothetical protein
VEEDAMLLAKYAEYGTKWNQIAPFFTNRSNNSLRNRWQMLNRHDLRDRRKSTKAALKATKAQIREQRSQERHSEPAPARHSPPSVIPVEKKTEEVATTLHELGDRLESRDSFWTDSDELWLHF